MSVKKSKILIEAEAKIAELEKRAYAEELTELIKSTSIVADFAKIQAKVKDITPLAILEAVASAVGIKRLQVTQAPPATRKPRAAKKAGSK